MITDILANQLRSLLISLGSFRLNFISWIVFAFCYRKCEWFSRDINLLSDYLPSRLILCYINLIIFISSAISTKGSVESILNSDYANIPSDSNRNSRSSNNLRLGTGETEFVTRSLGIGILFVLEKSMNFHKLFAITVWSLKFFRLSEGCSISLYILERSSSSWVYYRSSKVLKEITQFERIQQ